MGCTVEAVVLRSAMMIVSALTLVRLSTGTSMEHFSMSQKARWRMNEGKLTSDEARSVVQEVSSSLKITFHLSGDPSIGKVNQKVAP